MELAQIELPEPSLLSLVEKQFPEYDFGRLAELGEILFPIKHVTEILTLIENNKQEEISVIDWLMLFSEKEHWQGVELDNSKVYSSIWDTIFNNPTASYIAANCLLRVHDKTLELAEAQLRLELQKTPLDLMPLILEISTLICKQEWKVILKKALNKNQTLKEYIDEVGLSLSYSQLKYVQADVQYICDLKNTKHAKWLVKNWNMFDQLLIRYNLKKLCNRASAYRQNNDNFELELNKVLINWLRKNGSIKQLQELGLTRIEQEIISSISHQVHFSRFAELIEIITDPSNDDFSKLPSFVVNQLRSRKSFFECYKSQITNMKFYVPMTTYDFIEKNNNNLIKYISSFKPGNKLNAEVAIIELEGVIIVEVFREPPLNVLRGLGVEQRSFFKKVNIYSENSVNGNRLINEGVNWLVDILKSKPDYQHDHCEYWENSLEEILRERHSIFVDEGLKYFIDIERPVLHGVPEKLTSVELRKRYFDISQLNENRNNNQLVWVNNLNRISEKHILVTFNYKVYSQNPSSTEFERIAQKVEVFGDDIISRELCHSISDNDNYMVFKVFIPETREYFLTIKQKPIDIPGNNKKYFDSTFIGLLEIID